MPGGFAGLVLTEWSMTPLLIALAVLPGLGFAGVAARHTRLSWPETIATSFAFSVALTSAANSKGCFSISRITACGR